MTSLIDSTKLYELRNIWSGIVKKRVETDCDVVYTTLCVSVYIVGAYSRRHLQILI